MTLEKLEHDILEKAKKEQEKLSKETEQHVHNLEEEAQERLSQKKKSLTSDFKEEMSRLEQLQTTRQVMTTKRHVLGEKKNALDALYQEFLEHLEKNKKTILKQLATRAQKTFTPGKVVVNEKDKTLVKALFSGVTIRTAPMTSGFILESKDGQHILDQSFDTLLVAVREKTLKEVSEQLFGGRQ